MTSTDIITGKIFRGAGKSKDFPTRHLYTNLSRFLGSRLETVGMEEKQRKWCDILTSSVEIKIMSSDYIILIWHKGLACARLIRLWEKVYIPVHQENSHVLILYV